MRRLPAFSFLVFLWMFMGIAPAHAGFSSADLEGHWRGGWMETTGTDSVRYWLNVHADVGSDGSVTGGSWWSSGGLSGSVTGGDLSIEPDGYIDGTMTFDDSDTGDVFSVSIEEGQMDESGGIVYLAFRKPDPGGERAAGTMVKREPNADHAQAELAGSWQVIILETDPSESYDTYWIDTTLTVDASGQTSGTWNYEDILSGDILSSSQVNLESKGGLGGVLNIDNGVQVPISYGQLDPDLNFGYVTSTKSDGHFCAALFLRTGGSGFATEMLAGEWSIVHTLVQDGSSLTWVFGQVMLDGDGNVLRGQWDGPNGESGTYTAGSLSVNDAGKLTGSITDSEGRVHAISNGHLGLTGSYGAAATRYADGGNHDHTLGVLFMARPARIAGTIPSTFLLLQ
jgi:hypothetical protein